MNLALKSTLLREIFGEGQTGSEMGMERSQADHEGGYDRHNYEWLSPFKTALKTQVPDQTIFHWNEQVAEYTSDGSSNWHLEKGRRWLLVEWNPFFSTDTTAALRAAEIKACCFDGLKWCWWDDSAILKDSKVKSNTTIQPTDIINEIFGVMDTTASTFIWTMIFTSCL